MFVCLVGCFFQILSGQYMFLGIVVQLRHERRGPGGRMQSSSNRGNTLTPLEKRWTLTRFPPTYDWFPGRSVSVHLVETLT